MTTDILSTDGLIISFKQFVEFGKEIYGLVNKPYQTYRHLALRKPYLHLIFIALFIFMYLSLSTLAKESLSSNPLFLTKSLVKVGLVISFSFIFVSLFIYKIAQAFGGIGGVYRFILLWAYSLIPTLSWFIITTIFYVLIPPPRTLSLKGQLFSILFVTFSLACFFWKGILYYLTLRVGMHLNAYKIALASIIIGTGLFFYAAMLYKLKIFGVPFI